MTVSQKLLDDFDPLLQPSAAAGPSQASPSSSQLQRGIIAKAEAQRAHVLDGLQEEFTDSADTSPERRRRRSSRSPVRPTFFPPANSRRLSNPQLSPVEVDLFHSATAQNSGEIRAQRRRLSRSLGSDEFSDFVSSQTTSQLHERSKETQPAHTNTTLNIANAGKTIGATVNALRPAIANLFQDSNNEKSPKNGSKNTTTQRTMKFFDGAPGFDSSAPPISFKRPPSKANTHPTLSPRLQSPSPNHSPSPSPPPPNPIVLHGLNSGKSILTQDLAESIRPSLPSRLRVTSDWTVLYSLDMHGVSISTLYTRVQSGMAGRGSSAGLVLVVQSADGHFFGAFVNEALHRSDSFYGNGECFLWKATEFPSDDFRIGRPVRSYRWTGRNNFMVQSDDEFISVGGGDGKFGLWIDAAFEKGYSARSSTFDNDPLCPPSTSPSQRKNGYPNGSLHNETEESRFEVNRVEVWRVGG